MPSSTLTDLLQWGRQQVDSLEAELLLAFAIKKPRVHLHTWPEQEASSEQLSTYQKLIQLRIQGEPVAYLTGQREFWSQELQVTSATLIPRPETETLVECALTLINNIKQPQIADLGTGSGAIAIALATERQDAVITATDSSLDALTVAKQNALNLKLTQIQFLHTSWCSDLAVNNFDLIASNPPYIASDDPHLKQGDLRFEPVSALSSGADGLDDIRIICPGAYQCLKSGGWLILEHGYDQAESVLAILESNSYINCGQTNDINGIPRVSWGQKP